MHRLSTVIILLNMVVSVVYYYIITLVYIEWPEFFNVDRIFDFAVNLITVFCIRMGLKLLSGAAKPYTGE
jgi:hypothetical protein